MPHILFVEDEEILGQLVREALGREQDFTVTWIRDGQTALDAFRSQRPDICILDIMMPVMDGFTLAKKIRAIDLHLPIIFLTARSQTSDVIRGFESGGDDYLKKPFSVEELVVRIRALLRRQKHPVPATGLQEDVYEFGRYQFFPASRVLKSPEAEFKLTHKEAELLRELVIHINSLLERKKVLLRIWGDDNFFNARNMDVYIVKLRKYLVHDPALAIINVRGYGYKLVVHQ